METHPLSAGDSPRRRGSMMPIVVFAGICYAFLLAFALTRPTSTGGTCGVGGSDAHLTLVPEREATLRVVVSDSRYGQTWEQYWHVTPQIEKGTIRLVASTTGERALFGVRLRTVMKQFKLDIPFDEDVRGTKNTFTYEVRWLKKHESTVAAE
jgi:hypothetical protein